MSQPLTQRARMAAPTARRSFPTLVPPGSLVEGQLAPARPARARRRHLLVLLSFLCLVLGQSALAGWYLHTRAADQYAASFGFTVHSEAETAGSLLQAMPGLSALAGGQSSDSDILYEYLHSQALVAETDAALDLRAIWAAPARDPVFAFDPEGSIEDSTRYWPRMVHVDYEAGAGILSVEARAFDPDLALALAHQIEAACTALINRLSAIARADRLSHAERELARAEARLGSARQALTQFRATHRIVDPIADLEGEMGVIQRLQQSLAEELVTLDLLRATTGQSGTGKRKGEITDARITQSQRRIDVIEARITEERSKFGDATGERNYARLMGEFERLLVDVEVAQEAYVLGLASYETARAESDRQMRYLATFNQPTRPERALYPDRIMLLLAIAAGALLLWAVLVLGAYSLRDRS
ncbi:sugar transporter [Roseovarius sp. C7]|uniref:sugar transporter n=1 Tax=Roseovarius sp. C7 TaxID=3398643 RepID=UPI0039F72E92